MSELRDLYQEVILDHVKRPRNSGALAGASHRADGDNPLCGDKVTIFLTVENGRIADVRFQGRGCAISGPGREGPDAATRSRRACATWPCSAHRRAGASWPRHWDGHDGQEDVWVGPCRVA